MTEQECIPVGCVPSAAAAVPEGVGGVLPGGVCASWGVCASQGGVIPAGVLPLGYASRGVCFPGGVCASRGGHMFLGGMPPGGSQHALSQTPPVDRHTPVKT